MHLAAVEISHREKRKFGRTLDSVTAFTSFCFENLIFCVSFSRRSPSSTTSGELLSRRRRLSSSLKYAKIKAESEILGSLEWYVEVFVLIDKYQGWRLAFSCESVARPKRPTR